MRGWVGGADPACELTNPSTPRAAPATLRTNGSKKKGPEGPFFIMPPLLGPHIHANANAVARVVVGTRGVLVTGVFVGHVIRFH